MPPPPASADAPPPDPPWQLAELLHPAAFPHAVTGFTVRETHLSCVVITGGFAYKIKKPLKLDFIDASSLERRARLCEEELRLNRRLAPELYLSVVEIRRDAHGVHLNGEGLLLDHAVCMRAFDPACELHALLQAGSIEPALLARLGRELAAFHEAAPALPADPAEYNAELKRTMHATLTTLQQHLDPERARELASLVVWIEEVLRRSRALVAERASAGCIREGHGDLHARNIVLWNGRLVPFDCLEFDARLRQIDVLSDAGFLVMDLVGHERRDLAATFLDAYLECTGDYAGLPLLPLFAVHRALVRAMVDALALEQHPTEADLRERLEARIRTAHACITPRRPLLCLLHGLSGSGKSWLSARLIAPCAAIRLRSDVERHRQEAGSSAPKAHDATARYAAETRRAVYEQLARSAAACLAGGCNTLVDATFLKAADRALLREVALHADADFRILDCRASRATLEARVRSRSSRDDPSEATLAVLEAQRREQEPFTDEERARVIEIDTEALDAVERVVRAFDTGRTR